MSYFEKSEGYPMTGQIRHQSDMTPAERESLLIEVVLFLYRHQRELNYQISQPDGFLIKFLESLTGLRES
jgi:hypothetical protein